MGVVPFLLGALSVLIQGQHARRKYRPCALRMGPASCGMFVRFTGVYQWIASVD